MNRVDRIDDVVPVKTVLVSVSDKSGLPELIRGFAETLPEVTILSTGGTYRVIEQVIAEHNLAGIINLQAVTAYTGQPEMQGGLVKSLDFRIYLGLLSETYNEHHREDLRRTGSSTIDLTVVNLYPFTKTVAQPGANLEDARAHIDIGGPSMLRASAKNYLRVAALCEPDTYSRFLDELRSTNGGTSLQFRYQLARAAFRHTAEYDTAIADYLNRVDLPQDLYTIAQGDSDA